MPYHSNGPCSVKSQQNQKIYITGGVGPKNIFLKTALAYDIQRSEFEELSGEMITGRANHVCQMSHGKVVVAGGRTSHQFDTPNTVDVYDIESEVWTKVDDLSVIGSLFLSYSEELLALDKKSFNIRVFNWDCNSWQDVDVNNANLDQNSGPTETNIFFPTNQTKQAYKAEGKWSLNFDILLPGKSLLHNCPRYS